MAIPSILRRVVLLLLLLAPSPAAADEALQREAEGAILAFVDAVASGDSAKLSAVLAPEFQIMRPNGVGYGRAEYLAQGALTVRITGAPTIESLVATREDDLLVTRYLLHVVETIEGKTVEARAPRLSVFRRVGERWLIVAHANFAAVVD
jgi:ketosteroid isomerase-like protein